MKRWGLLGTWEHRRASHSRIQLKPLISKEARILEQITTSSDLVPFQAINLNISKNLIRSTIYREKVCTIPPPLCMPVGTWFYFIRLKFHLKQLQRHPKHQKREKNVKKVNLLATLLIRILYNNRNYRMKF